jgi:hypothetical protein
MVLWYHTMDISTLFSSRLHRRDSKRSATTQGTMLESAVFSPSPLPCQSRHPPLPPPSVLLRRSPLLVTLDDDLNSQSRKRRRPS